MPYQLFYSQKNGVSHTNEQQTEFRSAVFWNKTAVRVVIDTNVVFEGLTRKGGACGLIIDAWRAGRLMNEVTLKMPKTLYSSLKTLAEEEAVPLTQYIVYILTRQISGAYTVRVIPDEDVVRQKVSFDSLLRKWGKVPPSETDRILDGREIAEAEEELAPDVVSKLKARIAVRRDSYM